MMTAIIQLLIRSGKICPVLIIAVLFACHNKKADIDIAGEKWKDLVLSNKKWIQLERDSTGYLVYDPCNGDTPWLELDSSRVVMHFSVDDPLSFKIKAMAFSGLNLEITGEGMSGTIARARWVDTTRMLVWWRFEIEDHKGGYQCVMTPMTNVHSFRHLDNPCPENMLPEKEFLPVLFN